MASIKSTDLSTVTFWQTAKKTGGMKAIPVKLAVNTIDAKLLQAVVLSTLEGTQALNPNKLLCQGAHGGEFWQQTTEKAMAKYDLVTFDTDGWAVFKPKDGPSAYIQAFQTNLDMAGPDGLVKLLGASYGTIDTETGQYFQTGMPGCWIAKLGDKDFYIIEEMTFFHTYTVQP